MLFLSGLSHSFNREWYCFGVGIVMMQVVKDLEFVNSLHFQ